MELVKQELMLVVLSQAGEYHSNCCKSKLTTAAI